MLGVAQTRIFLRGLPIRGTPAAMELPYLVNAIVPTEKITTYLLNAGHEEGGAKANFFMHFGFSLDDWQTLADALLAHAAQYNVVKHQSTPLAHAMSSKARYQRHQGVCRASVWYGLYLTIRWNHGS